MRTHTQELDQVYRYNKSLKMWHIDARQYATAPGIIIAAYNYFACRKSIQNQASLDNKV